MILGAEYQRLFTAVATKIRALFNKQRRSSKAADIIHSRLSGLFVVENATRWNSTFKTFERVYAFAKSHPTSLAALFDDLELTKQSPKITAFTASEVLFIGEYLQVSNLNIHVHLMTLLLDG